MVIIVGGLFTYWVLRPNTADVSPNLELESWDVETGEPHNAFTDMLYWKGDFYLSFRTGPVHGTNNDSKIVVLKSNDARDWKTVEEFSIDGFDIRDPKLALINENLFVYVVKRALKEEGEEITTSQYSVSEDGNDWSKLKDIEPEGKRFWRAKTRDNNTWYCPIFEQGDVKLYNSINGVDWDDICSIYEGAGADESDFEILPDGRMIVSMRIQGGGTRIYVADHPYNDWNYEEWQYNRLDGPCLFSINDKIFAVGRNQPEVDNIFQQVGSATCRKRTSLFMIEEDRIIHLSDLPSSGDTSYPAVVIKGDHIYISYYTSDMHRDYPWFLGMVSSTKVRIAKISTSNLVDLAAEKSENFDNGIYSHGVFPWLDYIVFFSLIALIFFVGHRIREKNLIK